MKHKCEFFENGKKLRCSAKPNETLGESVDRCLADRSRNKVGTRLVVDGAVVLGRNDPRWNKPASDFSRVDFSWAFRLAF